MNDQINVSRKKRLLAVAELFSHVTTPQLLRDAFSELGYCLVQYNFAKYTSAKRAMMNKYDDDELVKISLSFFEINESVLQGDLDYACRAGAGSCKNLAEQTCKTT